MGDSFSHSRRTLLAAGAGSFALLAAGCAEHGLVFAPSGLRAFHGLTMGSTYTVKLFAPGLAAGELAAAQAAVEAALGGVVARMSTFDPASELSRFSRHGSDRPFALSPDTWRVLELAQQVSARSRGAFDVTVAPVVNAWGFGPGGRRARPADEDLARARATVGWQALELDAARGTAAKAHPALAADLSGIAKGYAVDLAARSLDGLGFERYMVEAGGEIRTRGANANGMPWQLGIERPDAMPRRAHRIVPLAGLSMATSGDYRIYFEEGGRRYSHEIDPASGVPAAHRLASVTVVARECALADAWATGLFVLGPEAGLALAAREGLAACFIERTPEGGFADRLTPAFATLASRRT